MITYQVISVNQTICDGGYDVFFRYDDDDDDMSDRIFYIEAPNRYEAFLKFVKFMKFSRNAVISNPQFFVS